MVKTIDKHITGMGGSCFRTGGDCFSTIQISSIQNSDLNSNISRVKFDGNREICFDWKWMISVRVICQASEI